MDRSISDIFDSHLNELKAFALGKTANEDLTNDIIQELLLKAIK